MYSPVGYSDTWTCSKFNFRHVHNVNIEASFLHGPHAYICNDHDAIIVTKLRFGLFYVVKLRQGSGKVRQGKAR